MNKSDIIAEKFLPKLNQNSSFMPMGSLNPGNITDNFNINNNSGFLPAINTQKNNIWESLQEIKKKKMEKMQRKESEEKVFKALEKQTEMLAEISRRFKRQSEEEETRLLKKIKELERENAEILWQRRNEDIIQQKVIESKFFS